MPNEAPTAETADVDFAALLRNEQAGLQAQLKELGLRGPGEWPQLRLQLRRLQPGDGRAGRGRAAGRRAAGDPRRGRGRHPAPRRRDLRDLRGVREADRRRPGSRPCRRPASASPTPPSTRCAHPEPPRGGARWTSERSARCGSSPASSSSWRSSSTTTSRRQEIIIFCVIVPSIILHEVSHGWVANAFGDDTAKRAGRLTLNPVVHVDPVGTLHRARPALAGRRRRLRLGQARPGQRRRGCAARATRACWSRWPGRPINAAAGRPSSGSSSSSSSGPACSRPGSFSTGAQIVFYASLVNVGPVRLQPDPGPAARRIGRSSSACCRRATGRPT